MNKYFTFFFFLSWIYSTIVAGQTVSLPNGIVATVGPCTSTSDGQCAKQFTISNIPYKGKGFRCFFVYGDGTYESFDKVPTDNPGTVTLSRNHTYLKGGIFNAKLQFVQTYTDTGADPFIIDINGIEVLQDVRKDLEGMDDRDTVDLISSLMPKAGDKVIYGMSFRNPCSDGYYYSGEVWFKGEDAKVTLLIDNSNPNWRIDNEWAIYTVKDMLGNKQQNEFLEVEFANNVLDIRKVDFTISMKNGYCNEDTNVEGRAIEIQPHNRVISRDTVRSHDPNLIKADLDSLCTNVNRNKKTMTYTIIFQNTGEGPASGVRVVDIVPKYFVLKNIQDIKMEDPSKELIPYSVNYETREIEWFMNSSSKVPLKDKTTNFTLIGNGREKKPGDNYTEDHTKDTIAFTLTFDHSVPLPSCGYIVNRAEIYFDDNLPVQTNDFYTEIKCMDVCGPCGVRLPVLKDFVGPFRNDGANPVKLTVLDSLGISLSDDMQLEWYPSKWLIDTGSPEPYANPEKNYIYTLVITKGCSKQIVQVSVDKFSKPINPINPPFEWWWWWWTLLIIPLVGFVFWKNKKKE